MTRSARWLSCLPIGLCLVVGVAKGQEPTSDLAQVLAVAESIVAREEAVSDRTFDPAFRAKAKALLATLPLAELLAQTGEDGLGLNALGDTQADLVYTPVTPCRIIDTRIAGGMLAVGAPRHFLVTGTDYSAQGGSPTGCGVPHGPATAAVVNLVAVDATGRGNLRITPFGTPLPTASIINYTTGFNIANGPAVALCNASTTTCSSDITIEARVSPVHLVADVQGYFQRVSAGGVTTALLADSAVTAPKISSGTVVRSLNGQTDAVTLAGTNGLSVAQGSGTVTVSSSATSANTPSTIVARDASGNFSAGSVTVASSLGLPNTTSPTVGVLTKGGARFLHSYGTSNSFVGTNAGNTSMSGTENTGMGEGALSANTSGNYNSAFGSTALFNNTEGEYNSVFGSAAASRNEWGSANSAFGFSALGSNTTGANNSAFGTNSLGGSSTGDYNSAFGDCALCMLASGDNNIAVGRLAGYALGDGSSNIYVGNQGVSSESSTIRIGDSNQAATYIAGISGQTSASGVAVFVNSDGKLGTTTSSRRYKEQVADMDAESDVLLKLRPVSFYYRPELDETHLRQYGLVAEEVADAAPGLVAYDEDGTPQTVRYHLVNAMLLNEVQKQRRQIDVQDTEIRELREQLARLEARLAQ